MIQTARGGKKTKKTKKHEMVYLFIGESPPTPDISVRSILLPQLKF